MGLHGAGSIAENLIPYMYSCGTGLFVIASEVCLTSFLVRRGP